MSVIQTATTPAPPETPGASGAPPGPMIDRIALLDWLLPNCERDRVAILYPKGRNGLSPGWVTGLRDAARAIEAYRHGRLPDESFTSVTHKGIPYKITKGERLGLVPHRNGRVATFCADLDDHTGDGGNVHVVAALSTFLGAQPIVYTSKGGKGLHCFFRLAQSVDAGAFVTWARAWGFNRQGEPEIFPKTKKNTQAWLPNEHNDAGGDAYVSGTFERCVVTTLPPPPSVRLSTSTLTFLRGFVRKPGRNDALNKAAYELGRKRVSRDEAWGLCTRGAQLCGLYAEEPENTSKTFESGFTAGSQAPAAGDTATVVGVGGTVAEPASVSTFRGLDGIGNGERFIDNFGGLVRFCYELDTWLVWTGTHWSTESMALVEAMAKKTARLILVEMERAMERAEIDGQTPEEIEAIEKAYQAHYKSTARVRGVKDMLTMAQSEHGVKVTIDQLDADPMVLNVANGTIDLREGTLRPHRRADGITKMSPATFDRDAPCALWLSFLDRIFSGDSQLIAFIQRAVGYTLTGSVSEQCLFFLHGSGQNGKSVFIHTLLYVFGDYGQKAPTEIIMNTERCTGTASPELARIRGARFVVASEVEDNVRIGEARVKDLTGSDRVTARQLYHDPIEFDPTHKLWIYGNHKPTIRGTDEGIWRRIRLIPFAVTIPEKDKDPDLVHKLQAERDGVLAWAVRGSVEWARTGLGLPSAVAEATKAYRTENDRVGEFLDERCIDEHFGTEPAERCAKDDVYRAYETWCRDSGEYVISKRKLGQLLQERGFQETRGHGGRRFWLGLGLKAPWPSDNGVNAVELHGDTSLPDG